MKVRSKVTKMKARKIRRMMNTRADSALSAKDVAVEIMKSCGDIKLTTDAPTAIGKAIGHLMERGIDFKDYNGGPKQTVISGVIRPADQHMQSSLVPPLQLTSAKRRSADKRVKVESDSDDSVPDLVSSEEDDHDDSDSEYLAERIERRRKRKKSSAASDTSFVRSAAATTPAGIGMRSIKTDKFALHAATSSVTKMQHQNISSSAFYPNVDNTKQTDERKHLAVDNILNQKLVAAATNSDDNKNYDNLIVEEEDDEMPPLQDSDAESELDKHYSSDAEEQCCDDFENRRQEDADLSRRPLVALSTMGKAFTGKYMNDCEVGECDNVPAWICGRCRNFAVCSPKCWNKTPLHVCESDSSCSSCGEFASKGFILACGKCTKVFHKRCLPLYDKSQGFQCSLAGQTCHERPSEKEFANQRSLSEMAVKVMDRLKTSTLRRHEEMEKVKQEDRRRTADAAEAAREQEKKRKKDDKEARRQRQRARSEESCDEDPSTLRMRLQRAIEQEQRQRLWENELGIEQVGRCGRPKCIRYSRRISDDKKYVRVHCSEKCLILYHHPDCWRAVIRSYSSHDLEWGAPCLTPHCDGQIECIEVCEKQKVDHTLVRRKPKEVVSEQKVDTDSSFETTLSPSPTFASHSVEKKNESHVAVFTPYEEKKAQSLRAPRLSYEEIEKLLLLKVEPLMTRKSTLPNLDATVLEAINSITPPKTKKIRKARKAIALDEFHALTLPENVPVNEPKVKKTAKVSVEKPVKLSRRSASRAAAHKSRKESKLELPTQSATPEQVAVAKEHLTAQDMDMASSSYPQPVVSSLPLSSTEAKSYASDFKKEMDSISEALNQSVALDSDEFSRANFTLGRTSSNELKSASVESAKRGDKLEASVFYDPLDVSRFLEVPRPRMPLQPRPAAIGSAPRTSLFAPAISFDLWNGGPIIDVRACTRGPSQSVQAATAAVPMTEAYVEANREYVEWQRFVHHMNSARVA